MVAALLAAKADVHLTSNTPDKSTALLIACYYNAGLKVVKKLVEAGSDVVATNSMGYNALHSFVRTDHVDDQRWPGGEKERIAMAEYLLQHGAQPCLSIKENKVFILFFTVLPLAVLSMPLHSAQEFDVECWIVCLLLV